MYALYVQIGSRSKGQRKMETPGRMETAAMCPFEAARGEGGEANADSTFLSKLSLLLTTSGHTDPLRRAGQRVTGL